MTCGVNGVHFWSINKETDWDGVWRDLCSLTKIEYAFRSYRLENMKHLAERQQRKKEGDKEGITKEKKEEEEREEREREKNVAFNLEDIDITNALDEIAWKISKEQLIEIIENNTKYTINMIEDGEKNSAFKEKDKYMINMEKKE